MICSSEFSFDENCVWDPKAVRQLLIISEDQLNILNNIPEWTKEKEDNYYSRINYSCVNTQVEFNSSRTFSRNQEVINSNIELFNKNFDSREKNIQAYKLNALKFSKSISLFEIDKISTNLPCSNSLSPALSLPNLSFSKDFSAQFETKSYLCEKSNLSILLNSNIINIGKSKTCVEIPSMEVVSQLPAVVPQIVENNENFAVVDKTVLSASQTNQSSDNSNNSCDLLSTSVDVNKSDHLSSIATKVNNLVEIDKLNSGDKNVSSNEDKQIIVSNNDNLDLQKNTTKSTEPTDLNLNEIMETDSSITRESIVNNMCIQDTSKKTKSELEVNTKNEFGKYVEEILKGPVGKELQKNLNEYNELLDLEKNLDKAMKAYVEDSKQPRNNELQVTIEENVTNNASSLNKDKNSNIDDVEGKILNEVNETSVEISKPPGKNELQVSTEENVTVNASSLNKNKNFNIDGEGKIQSKISETLSKISNQPGIDHMLSDSIVTVVSSDTLESKMDSSYDSRMNAEISFETACRGAGDAEAATSQNLPLKRKSESKARSSKRSKGSRDKQECPDVRSIKKASEIHYSAEDMKIMFDSVSKTACRGDGEAVTSQNLPLKRKLESKDRSSKRRKGSRDKQECPNIRSIEKASEINYSAEDMKIMFDLLKLFL